MRSLFAVLGLALWACRSEPIPPDSPVPGCLIGPSGGVCSQSGCTLVLGPSATGRPVAVELVLVPPPSARDPFGAVACAVGPPGLLLEPPGRLDLDAGEPAPGFRPEDAVAVRVDPELRLEPASRRTPDGRGVVVSVSEAGTFAVAFVASSVRTVTELGVEARGEDPASRLRRRSAQRFTAAFSDGRRVFLGQGPRVLVWRDGVPSDPAAAPDVVVGSARADGPGGQPSAAELGAIVGGIWSDGERLAVAAGNRILIWNRVPEEDGAPADLVLGQSRFDEDLPNRGRDRPGPDTLNRPGSMASDGGRLLVADTMNHRFLVFSTFPRLVGQPADLVIGQQDFERNDIRGGAIPVFQARGVLLHPEWTMITSSLGSNSAFGLRGLPSFSNPSFDRSLGSTRYITRVGPLEFGQPGAMAHFGTGGFALRDFVGRRVHVWREFPAEDDRAADIVLGKPGPDVGGDEVGGVSASTLGEGDPTAGLYADGNRMLVPDGPRVLVFEPLPRFDFEPAARVIGQASFSSREYGVDYRRIDDDTVARPAALAFSERGTWAIADTANDRVLLRAPGRATVVLGQPNPGAYGSGRGPDRDTLRGPDAVLFVGDRLYVADTGHHRILVWDRVPAEDGAPADRVIGQPDFTSGRPKASGESAAGFFYPRALAVRGDRLVVADAFHHRVVALSLDGASVDHVLGQADLDGHAPNRGLGFLRPAPDGLAAPSGLAVDSAGRLYVADTENNRVLRFDGWGPRPDAVFGQPDLETQRWPNFVPNAPGFPLTEAQREAEALSVRRPSGLFATADQLFVADTGNHRVLELPLERFDRGEAVRWLGQDGPARRSANAFGPGPRSLHGPSGVAVSDGRLHVVDRENHRILGFALSTSADAADEVFGQPDFLETRFNRSVGDRDRLSEPTGVVRAGGKTWVSDPARHRVLAYGDEGEVVLVLGQPNPGRVLPNAGGAPSAATLRSPTGIASDGQRLVVADTGNDRVLVWLRLPEHTSSPADLVIGHAGFDQGSEASGFGDAGPDRLSGPTGVAIDGDRLLVADSGHHRVLVFERFSERNQPRAVDVLCQADFEARLPNRGQPDAGADRCFAPSAVVAVGEQWAVADLLNDRVLVFPSVGAAGRPARVALGQPDLESRRPPSEPRADRLSGPSALATDGLNLFVSDSGHHRVVVFSAESLETGAPASRVVGQLNPEVAVPSRSAGGFNRPAGLVVEPVSPFESRLWVADRGNSRVVALEGVRR